MTFYFDPESLLHSFDTHSNSYDIVKYYYEEKGRFYCEVIENLRG